MRRAQSADASRGVAPHAIAGMRTRPPYYDRATALALTSASAGEYKKRVPDFSTGACAAARRSTIFVRRWWEYLWQPPDEGDGTTRELIWVAHITLSADDNGGSRARPDAAAYSEALQDVTSTSEWNIRETPRGLGYRGGTWAAHDQHITLYLGEKEWVSVREPEAPDEAPQRKQRGCIGLGSLESAGEEGNGVRVSYEEYENDVLGSGAHDPS
ncbi:MAG: hypothetical protein SGPRY_001853 [Prymnesium sp.]